MKIVIYSICLVFLGGCATKITKGGDSIGQANEGTAHSIGIEGYYLNYADNKANYMSITDDGDSLLLSLRPDGEWDMLMEFKIHLFGNLATQYDILIYQQNIGWRSFKDEKSNFKIENDDFYTKAIGDGNWFHWKRINKKRMPTIFKTYKSGKYINSANGI